MRRLAAILVVAACTRVANGQMQQIATYAQGEVRFTQGGKPATWTLHRGDAQELPGPQTMRMASLLYTPDGTYATSTAPSFKLTIGLAGSVATIAVLAVEHGPGGSGAYRSRLAQCTLTVAKLDASGVEGSGACSGAFDGGPPVTEFAFTARAAPTRPPARTLDSPKPPPAGSTPQPLLLDAMWTFDVQQPQVGWVKMQVQARYRTEVVRHPRRGWYGARSCLGLADVPVSWDSVAAGAPFCIKLTYVDGGVVYATGETTAGKTTFALRPPAEPSPAFPDGKIFGPLEQGGVRIELERRPWADAVENEEAAGCAVAPDPVLTYADLRTLPRLERRWTKPSWDDWASTCTGQVLLEIRVRRQG